MREGWLSGWGPRIGTGRREDCSSRLVGRSLSTNAGRQLGMDHTTVRFRLRLCSSLPFCQSSGLFSPRGLPCVWLSLGREGFHSEVSYILATSKTSQEDGLFFDLRSADVPVRVQDRLKFSCVLDFCLVEDECSFSIFLLG